MGGDYWQGGESSTLALGGHPNTKASQIQSMYRWLLGDAIPFGESIQLSIEHGGTNMVDQEYEAVTMFYARSGAWLRLVDKVTIGDPPSESQHNYSNTDAGEVYHITSGWVGAPPANDSDTGSVPPSASAANDGLPGQSLNQLKINKLQRPFANVQSLLTCTPYSLSLHSHIHIMDCSASISKRRYSLTRNLLGCGSRPALTRWSVLIHRAKVELPNR